MVIKNMEAMNDKDNRTSNGFAVRTEYGIMMISNTGMKYMDDAEDSKRKAWIEKLYEQYFWWDIGKRTGNTENTHI
jgi:hypothetical protein